MFHSLCMSLRRLRGFLLRLVRRRALAIGIGLALAQAGEQNTEGAQTQTDGDTKAAAPVTQPSIAPTPQPQTGKAKANTAKNTPHTADKGVVANANTEASPSVSPTDTTANRGCSGRSRFGGSPARLRPSCSESYQRLRFGSGGRGSTFRPCSWRVLMGSHWCPNPSEPGSS